MLSDGILHAVMWWSCGFTFGLFAALALRRRALAISERDIKRELAKHGIGTGGVGDE